MNEHLVPFLRDLGRTRWIVTLALLAGACAPRPVSIPRLEPAALQVRYVSARSDREARVAGVDADVSLWLRTGAGAQPGVQATLLLGALDRFRLRVGSLFGTALDVGGVPERIDMYVPGERMAFVLDGRNGPPEMRGASSWIGRAWSATWQPPAGAWLGGTWADSLLVLRWISEGDSLSLAVGSHGLPHHVDLKRPGTNPLRLEYRAWRYEAGVAWPVRMAAYDDAGQFRLDARVHRFRFGDPPGEERLAVRIPADARMLSWEELLDMFQVNGEGP